MKATPGRAITAPVQSQSPTTLPPHHTNRPLAEALLAAASGDRAIVATAVPGAGKTWMLSHLAHQLTTRMRLRVAIATQTREQSYDIANRIAALGTPTHHLRGRDEPRSRSLAPEVTSLTSHSHTTNRLAVTVATSARWLHTPISRMNADVLAIDEAYQMTYADLIALGDLAEQIVLVGDPGQIAPVATGATRRWAHSPVGPHLPAPLALMAAHPDTTQIKLDTTYRLGTDSANLLAPLYPAFPFTSARPPSHMNLGGVPLPEYRSELIHLRLGHTDPKLAAAAAHAARTLLDSTITTTDGTRATQETDLAVIVPHVHQAALVAAHLADHPGILVATANQAQGLERHGVVAVHPLAGYQDTPTFALDLGRLCVSLSRHRSHLTLIADDETTRTLNRSTTDQPEATTALEVHRTVLRRLLA